MEELVHWRIYPWASCCISAALLLLPHHLPRLYLEGNSTDSLEQLVLGFSLKQLPSASSPDHPYGESRGSSTSHGHRQQSPPSTPLHLSDIKPHISMISAVQPSTSASHPDPLDEPGPLYIDPTILHFLHHHHLLLPFLLLPKGFTEIIQLLYGMD